jgi:hypothetical protein
MPVPVPLPAPASQVEGPLAATAEVSDSGRTAGEPDAGSVSSLGGSPAPPEGHPDGAASAGARGARIRVAGFTLSGARGIVPGYGRTEFAVQFAPIVPGARPAGRGAGRCVQQGQGAVCQAHPLCWLAVKDPHLPAPARRPCRGAAVPSLHRARAARPGHPAGARRADRRWAGAAGVCRAGGAGLQVSKLPQTGPCRQPTRPCHLLASSGPARHTKHSSSCPQVRRAGPALRGRAGAAQRGADGNEGAGRRGGGEKAGRRTPGLGLMPLLHCSSSCTACHHLS